jgi:hypothetical protein
VVARAEGVRVRVAVAKVVAVKARVVVARARAETAMVVEAMVAEAMAMVVVERVREAVARVKGATAREAVVRAAAMDADRTFRRKGSHPGGWRCSIAQGYRGSPLMTRCTSRKAATRCSTAGTVFAHFEPP